MPIYEYKCPNCGNIFIDQRRMDEREDARCICGEQAVRVWTAPARPVVYEYYSENLGTVITGPRQKARIMQARNVREAA